MAVHFHSLMVKQVQRETADCVSISFQIPDALKETFKFLPGQSITIRHSIAGEEVRRSYSICAAPHEQVLKIAVKKIDGGIFSSFANNELSAGTYLDVMPPTGKFNIKNAGPAHYLAIAAGSGITPVMSIIKSILHTQPESTCTLIFGNKSRRSIIFFEELEGLKNKWMQRFSFINILSQERTDATLNNGRITSEKLEQLSHIINYATVNEAVVCGPETMIADAVSFLETKNIKKQNIHFELFTVPGGITKTETLKEKPVEKGSKSKITIKLDGRSFDFNLAYDGESILDAALAQGADLPFACKGGVCCTCRAKLVQGEVKMDVNYALEAEEIAAGSILTCQSHPRTPEVIIDFDVK